MAFQFRLSTPPLFKKDESHPTNFLLMAAVWGKWYVEKFLEANLPSLLSGGNLPELSRANNGKFLIYTDQASVELIRQSAVFKEMSALVTIVLRVIPQDHFRTHAHRLHTDMWHEAAAEAKSEGRWVLFVSADVFWGDGALRRVAEAFRDGKKVVYFAPLRVIDETFAPFIRNNFPRVQSAIEANPDTLMKAALQHLAPMHSCYYSRGNHFALYHPEYLLFKSGRRQLSIRAVTFHCHAIDPSFFQLNDFNSPQELVGGEKHVAFLTDNFPCVSLTPTLHQISWLRLKQTINYLDVAKTWKRFHSPVMSYLWKHSFKFGALDAGERSSNFAINRTMALCYASYRLYDIWMRLGGVKNVTAARAIVGYLALHPRIMFRIQIPRRISFACPTDNASILAALPIILASPRRLAAFASDCMISNEPGKKLPSILARNATRGVDFKSGRIVDALEEQHEHEMLPVRIVLIENVSAALEAETP